MSTKNLVIVESPAKAKTITNFLGKNFLVLASYGHIRDLPKSKMGINIKKNFTPQYIISPNNFTKKALKKIKEAYNNEATNLYIATDEDREGEAIGWHLLKVLKPKNDDKVFRIVFHEITEEAITKAIKNPRDIDENLVNAQQARRVLDRLVGYILSPILWKKIQTGLSAGRVQSVALRLIVEKEKEIKNFKYKSNFKVTSNFLLENGQEMKAILNKKFDTSEKAVEFLDKCVDSTFKVSKIEKKPSIKTPPPPFTTSTLQQEASRKLGYSVKKTMMFAQKLYETGKITYMRTDSVNLSDFAIKNAEKAILKNYGKEYACRRHFKTKSKGAQEAHEAIRPTNFEISDTGNTHEEKKLYELIWKRAIASQMTNAKIEKTVIDVSISKSEYIFQSKAEIIVFDGFLKVYKTYNNSDDDISSISIPIKENTVLEFDNILAKEVFTKQPPRYSEASLVKTMEEMGIGRPSTYAPTISTIQERGYVIKDNYEGQETKAKLITLHKNKISTEELTETIGAEKNKLIPTAIGTLVSDFLSKHFPDIVDYDFTAHVEKEFDEIAAGKKEWFKMISEFYKNFEKTVTEKEKTITRAEATNTRILGLDKKTGKTVSARIGRYGPFVQIGSPDDSEKPRFAKLKKGQDLNTITLEEAMELFKLPRTIGKDKDGNEIIANIGRFGPYVKVNNLFVSIKDKDPMKITLDEAIELIDAKKKIEAEKLIKDFGVDNIKILNGKYGPYVTNGTKNAKIPDDMQDFDKITLEDVKELLSKAVKRKWKKKK